MPGEVLKGISDYMSIRYLDPKESKFERTLGGFLSLSIGEDEKHPRVNLHISFPFSNPRKYISVRDQEGKEIGIIKDMDEFPKETQELFEEQIHRRYFAPVILRINSIKEEFGYSYWDVLTDAGTCRFTVRGIHSSIINIEEKRLLILDIDGNRFEIPDYTKLDDKSFRRLEAFL